MSSSPLSRTRVRGGVTNSTSVENIVLPFRHCRAPTHCL
jgi:hypothetical protein